MLDLDDARRRILSKIPVPCVEVVDVRAAVGRILAEPVHSPIDLPPFDNSAMDGFAVRAVDLHRATAEAPVSLRLGGESPAGTRSPQPVESGTCLRIFTGSMLPPGADAVVMQEDVRQAPGQPEVCLFSEMVRPWENVRLQGEDVKQGRALLTNGLEVTGCAAALLAAAGVTHVRVGRQPVIGLVATGSELVEAGQPLASGHIYESNRAMLAAFVAQAGASPRIFPLVPDTLAATREMLERAFAECDGVITTGGVSVGEHDFVKQALSELGGELDFWKVAIRPGKPFVFGQGKGKSFFGLPGNPVSALVTFLVLVRPALRSWQGAANINLPVTLSPLAEPLVNRGDRRHFIRVTLDEQGKVHAAGVQASHLLGSLAKASGLVDVPPRSALEPGHLVPVLRWE